jgi:hypothetical protein
MGVLFIIIVGLTALGVFNEDGFLISWILYICVTIFAVGASSEEVETISYAPESADGKYVIEEGDGDDAGFYFFGPDGKRSWVYASRAEFVIADEPRVVRECTYTGEVADPLVWPFKFINLGNDGGNYSDCGKWDDTTFYLPESEMTLDMS